MPNWSADGAEIYFVRPGDVAAGVVAALDAVSLTGEVRVVDEGKGQYSSLAVAPDGTVYYADGAARHLFSTAADEPLPIALGPRTDVVAISPDGGRIAYYGRNDDADVVVGQLKVFSLVDASVVTLSDAQPSGRGVEPDNDRTVAFSPAGDQLFYVAGAADRGAGSGSGFIFDVTTGAVTSKSWDLGYNPLLHWGAAGLRLAAAGPDGSYAVLNLDTAGLVRLPAAATPEPMTDVWSPDGGRIAYWTTTCLESCGAFACCAGKTQHELLVANVSTGQVRRVAAAGDLTIPNGLGWIYGGISFSPDGTRIAYAIDGRIHVRDIR